MQSYEGCATNSCYLSLHEAAEKNDVEQLTYRLHASIRGVGVVAVVNRKNDKGQTPLLVAAMNNRDRSHYEVIEILLKNGADPNAKDNECHTPLSKLIENEFCLDILKLFFKFKAEITPTFSIIFPIFLLYFLFFSKAIESSSNNNHLDVLKFLVEDIGLDVNCRDIIKMTPLHYLADENKIDSHYEILKILLEMGADPNARNFRGWTPLYDLIGGGRGSLRVFELFLNHNADVHVLDDDGKNILFAFESDECDLQVLDRLICDFHLDVNQTDSKKRTPLHFIIQQEDYDNGKLMKLEAVKLMLKQGANINAPDENGVTPLMRVLRRIYKSSYEEIFLRNLDYFNFIIDQVDFSVVHNNAHILKNVNDQYYNPLEFVWKWILGHLAKLKFLSVSIHPIIVDFIENHADYKDYFVKCTEELENMSNTKFNNSWVTYFNLLVDTRRKLKNYAANEDLVQDYKNNDWLEIFPIYGASVKKNFEKGLRRRELFDKSVVSLSHCLPIFDTDDVHLIVRDVLDCIPSKKDLSKLCE